MKSEIYFPQEDSYFLTQILEEQIPKFLNQKPNLTFLEIGSGDGMHLGTSLKLGIKKQNLFSCDINPYSVKHCKKLGFNCVHSNLFEAFKGGYLKGRLSEDNLKGGVNVRGTLVPLKFDLIIFNPPYLPENSLEPESSKVSTTGGKLGSEVINEFLKQAKFHLNKNGEIFLLTSSLSDKINFLDYKKKILAKKKLFFEELVIWKLKITTK